jgi:hypothetical protein
VEGHIWPMVIVYCSFLLMEQKTASRKIRGSVCVLRRWMYD